MNEYLKSTVFHTREVAKFVREYLGNMRIVVLLVIALLGGGFISYKTLPQTVAPEINLSMVVVSAALPGASSENVESLVTIPLEDEIKGVSGIDSATSTSSNGVSSIVVTFTRGVTKDRALSDVESAVSRVAGLPDDTTTPVVTTVDFEDSPILRLAFTMEGESETSLSQHMQNIIDALEADSLIDRVVAAGQPTQEIQIMFSTEKMEALGLDIATVQSAVSSAVTSMPSGTVYGDHVERSLTINASIDTIEDVRSLPIMIGADRFVLSDIATIAERPEPGYVRAWYADGESTRSVVTLDIYRTSGVDITDASDRADLIIDENIAAADNVLEKTVLFSVDQDLTQQFNDLVRNLSITVMLVFITLMLFVGWRQALLASSSIPLTYAVAFIAMQLTDISVNFLSLFSLMISLGLLVDVTIVVVSAMTTYMREGSFSAYKTGLLVYRDFFGTLLITTLTTIWAFVPLLLAGGIIGEYIKPIPVIVSSVLLASVFIGVFVILPLMIWMFDFSMPRRVRVFLVGGLVIIFALILTGITGLSKVFLLPIIVCSALLLYTGQILLKNGVKKHQEKKAHKPAMLKQGGTVINVVKLENIYRGVLERILHSRSARRRTIAMVVVFFVFSFGLVGTGFVKNEFFPGDDAELFYVAVELPQGTRGEITEGVARSVMQEYAQIEGVAGVTMQVGFGINDRGEIGAVDRSNAILTIQTPTEGEGAIGSQTVAREARALPITESFTDAKLTIVEAAGGPPAGADVVITFVGDRLDTLRELARELEHQIIAEEIKVENIVISPRLAAATVSFEPDDTLLADLGVSRQTIASQLRLFASGITLAEDVEFEHTSSERDIVLRVSEENPDLKALGRVMISTPQGSVPLESLGNMRLTQNTSRIDRTDFDRTVTLTAALVGEANLVEVNTKIAEMIDGTQEKDGIDLPAGYSWRSGGANEENNDSVQSILQGMILAAALIFLTLIVHLKSYRKAAIVLLTIPLAASGVFIVFALTGVPLSFPALIGVLALFGIVVNNAIIVISQINANRAVGMEYTKSIVEGASSRLEPIMMSSITTIIGLLPITMSDPLWQGLGGAIISGLLFSGVIMLFFIPTVYHIFMNDERETQLKIVE